MFSSLIVIAGIFALKATAFNNSRYDNVAVYWGQNSYGAVNPTNTADWQQRLSYYCNDDAIDVFPVAFLDVFFGTGGAPSLNLANTCNPTDNATFPGTELPDCSSLASDITTCQSMGKIVTLSLGGATGAVGFSSDAQASTFAQTIWDMFLGGTSSTRPFGSAVLDGVDLDIEGGGSTYYNTFVNEIRSLSSGAPKQYYVTAAPQCVFPDANLGAVINSADFDAVYGKWFYNNYCGLQAFGETANWNFGIWDNWARTTSPNKNVKVYIGAPASSSAAGSGYVAIGTLSSIATQMRNNFPSFGGVMLWDASQAYANNRYDLAIKNSLIAAGGTGFTFPPCTAPAWVAGTNYAAGAQVSFGGYIWQANYFASDQPASNPSGDWSAISACGGPAIPPSSSSTTTTTTTTTTTSSTTSTTPSTTSTTSSTTSTTSSTTSKTSSTTSTTRPVTSPTTSSSPTTSPGGNNCAGIAAWSSAVAYQGGSEVVYNSTLWTAKWWSEADVPGGVAGDWTNDGPCGSSAQAAETLSPKAQETSPSATTASPIKKSRFF